MNSSNFEGVTYDDVIPFIHLLKNGAHNDAAMEKLLESSLSSPFSSTDDDD